MILLYVIYLIFLNDGEDDGAAFYIGGCLFLPLILFQMIFVLLAPNNRQVLMEQVIHTNDEQTQPVVISHSIAKSDNILEKIVKWFARIGLGYVMVLAMIATYLIAVYLLLPLLEVMDSSNSDEQFCVFVLLVPIFLIFITALSIVAISGTSVALSFKNKADGVVEAKLTPEAKMAMATAVMKQSTKKVVGNLRKKLEDMTVPQLKEQLKEKGLPVSGKKADLVARLRENQDNEISLEGD